MKKQILFPVFTGLIVLLLTTCNDTFDPAIRGVSIDYPDEPVRIAAGKEMTLTATIIPTTAKEKNLIWSIQPDTEGISVDNESIGKIRVAGSAKAGNNARITVKTVNGFGDERLVLVIVE